MASNNNNSNSNSNQTGVPCCVCQALVNLSVSTAGYKCPAPGGGCGAVFCPGCLADFIENRLGPPATFPVRCCPEVPDWHMSMNGRAFCLPPTNPRWRRLWSRYDAAERAWTEHSPTYCRRCAVYLDLSAPDPANRPTEYQRTSVPGPDDDEDGDDDYYHHQVLVCPRPGCGASTCCDCGLWAHDGACPDDGSADVEELCDGVNFQKCPQCGRIVEKVEGCNHINCMCGHNFCFRCCAEQGDCACDNGSGSDEE